MTFSRGALFGSYEIAEPIGSGGMGEVYRGGPDGSLGRAWDVDSKNDRFLMITLPDESPAAREAPSPRPQIKVVLNWFEELDRRLPKR